MTDVIAVTTDLAEQQARRIGPAAVDALKNLRAELEDNPRLGRMRGATPEGVEVYLTHIEPRPDMPPLTVTYVYTPDPPPPTVAISVVTPHDTPEDDT
ncbi:hypothetical protein [Streptomyces gobiensis]|uniref:hypothetical protein n=1 Tax=Streptomyces gobiensis TaxID=2875706 RepID=UPI001E54BB6F|nr:hypothetical protein [Streptomyces gobiensis]UGY94098.1 hypothetical protein test1122_21845 [Streptomyces gobiensis]